jgi:hypothetical protein
METLPLDTDWTNPIRCALEPHFLLSVQVVSALPGFKKGVLATQSIDTEVEKGGLTIYAYMESQFSKF